MRTKLNDTPDVRVQFADYVDSCLHTQHLRWTQNVSENCQNNISCVLILLHATMLTCSSTKYVQHHRIQHRLHNMSSFCLGQLYEAVPTCNMVNKSTVPTDTSSFGPPSKCLLQSRGKAQSVTKCAVSTVPPLELSDTEFVTCAQY